MNMKKITYLFVAFAFVGAIVLSSCKTKTETPAAEEPVIEETAPVADTVAADTTMAM